MTARVVRGFEVQAKGQRASEWELVGNRKATGQFPKPSLKGRLSLVSSDLRRESNRTGAFCIVPQHGVIVEHVKQPSPVNERSAALVLFRTIARWTPPKTGWSPSRPKDDGVVT